MLVDFALEGHRERGLSSEEAVHEACRLRFRPILMTTLCALLAGVPLMLGTGTGSEIRHGWRFAGLATAHAIHYPDCLYLHGSRQQDTAVASKPQFIAADYKVRRVVRMCNEWNEQNI
jgi:hypothetical protein